MDIFALLELYVFLILGELLVLTVVIRIFVEKKKPSSMVAWLLATLFIPYLAVPFYFIFGIRKRKSQHYKSAIQLNKINNIANVSPHTISTVLTNQGIPEATTNNTLVLYTNGTDAFKALLQHINKATKSVYISSYVFKNDKVTQKLLEALVERARAGVKIKLLIDSLGSYQVYFWQRIFRPLKSAGGDICFFMPIIQMPFRNYINFRNHRKIYLFDGKSVLTGGMNLGNEYMGPEPCQKRWDDLLFLIRGDGVCHFHNIFVSDWSYSAKETIPEMLNSPTEYCGNNCLQIVPSGPDITNDALYESLITGIYAAQKRVWIITPYFIPSESLMEALKIAYYRGVNVKLITPKVSNHLIADLARSYYMRQLQLIGIDIILFDKKMIHAKAILFDDKAVMLGSVNLDNRSLFLNYEVVIFAYDKMIIEEICQWMSNLLANSNSSLPEPSRYRKIGENMVKFLVPLL